METCEVKTILVSSEARASGSSGSEYTVYLQTPVKSVVRAELLFASVPNTVLNVTNGTDVFTVQLDPAGSGPSFTFSIPVGFYSSGGITQTLSYASNVSGVVFEYQTFEGLFAIYNKTSPFEITVHSVELAKILGLDPGVTYASTATSSLVPTGTVYPLYSKNRLYETFANFVKSVRITNATPIDVFLLDIEELRSTSVFTGTASTCYGSTGFNPFAVIPVDVYSGNYVNYTKNSGFDFSIEYPYPIQLIDRLTIRWNDRDGKRVDFSGVDSNFVILRLYTTRKNPTVR